MRLAIRGGEKTVKKRESHYTWPKITEKTKKAVISQLEESISIYDRSGIIKRFEDKFGEYHGRQYALLTNSGTSAIHSLFTGANLKKNDEIIIPAYTFHATATPLFFTGANPVLVDSDRNGNIDPNKIEDSINRRTKGIMITHMWGQPCEMDKINTLAKKHGLELYEDCSHAHGATYQGKKVGKFGRAAAFSLQGKKTISGGEGGILITDDKELYHNALMFGHYNKRCKQEIPQNNFWYDFAVTGMGLKLRAHPLAVAIAEEQFNNIDEILEGRRKTAEHLSEELEKLPGITTPKIREGKASWYAFVMQYQPQELDNLPIEKFYAALKAEGCEEIDRPESTGPLNYQPLFQKPEILFPDYKGPRYKPGDFPQAEHFYKNALKLPVWETQESIIEDYIQAIKKVVNNYKQII